MGNKKLSERNKEICRRMSMLVAAGNTLENSAKILSAEFCSKGILLGDASMRAIYRYSPYMVNDGTAKKIQGMHSRVHFLEEKINLLKQDIAVLEKSLKVKLESH